MELERKGNKWSISSWDRPNGKKDDSKFWKTLRFLSFIKGIIGFLLVGYGAYTCSKSACIWGFGSLFMAVICFIVSELIGEAQRVNKDFKFVKNKWKKDEFFDN